MAAGHAGRGNQGYQGSPWATAADISRWLQDDIPVPEEGAGWDFFCQGMSGGTPGTCGNDPFKGGMNIYGSMTRKGFINGASAVTSGLALLTSPVPGLDVATEGVALVTDTAAGITSGYNPYREFTSGKRGQTRLGWEDAGSAALSVVGASAAAQSLRMSARAAAKWGAVDDASYGDWRAAAQAESTYYSLRGPANKMMVASFSVAAAEAGYNAATTPQGRS